MYLESIVAYGVSGALLLGVAVESIRRKKKREKLEDEKARKDAVLNLSVDAIITRLEQEAQREARKSRELFDVVEKVLGERDQWREMWHVQSRAHAEAQSMLEDAIVEARSSAISAIRSVNAYRKKAGQEPIPFGLEPGDKPVGSAAKFREMLQRAEAEAPKGVDGIFLRDEAMREVASD
jgi:hypothetical protein